MNREQSIARVRHLVEKRRLSEARNLCLDLSRVYPENLTIWLMRGDLHLKLGEFDSVVKCCQRIITRLSSVTPHNPTLIETYRVLGTAHFNAGRITEAIHAHEQLLAIRPQDADAHMFTAICHLLLGDFQRGWPEYEWRFKTRFMAAPFCAKPDWMGESLQNKIILVEAEQGHGDAIQFVRYLRFLKTEGAKVILGCQPALYRLMAGCAAADLVLRQGDLAPAFDVVTPLLSLPGIFKTTLETLPAEIPYLQAPSGSGMQAIAAINRYPGIFRAGLVWAGGAHNPNDRLRSLKLDQFSDLFRIAGTKFFSLQKSDAVTQLGSIPPGIITDLGPYLGDFADTAAAIQELDLVISVDTAVAHLAGALGKPVWTLIPFVPDWRWMLNREDSPWYPTMRLFRQPTPGDWASVISHVSEELKSLVGTK